MNTVFSLLQAQKWLYTKTREQLSWQLLRAVPRDRWNKPETHKSPTVYKRHKSPNSSACRLNGFPTVYMHLTPEILQATGEKEIQWEGLRKQTHLSTQSTKFPNLTHMWLQQKELPPRAQVPTSRASLTASVFSGRASVLRTRSSKVFSQVVSRSK